MALTGFFSALDLIQLAAAVKGQLANSEVGC